MSCAGSGGWSDSLFHALMGEATTCRPDGLLLQQLRRAESGGGRSQACACDGRFTHKVCLKVACGCLGRGTLKLLGQRSVRLRFRLR
jgi:hypothetical protein